MDNWLIRALAFCLLAILFALPGWRAVQFWDRSGRFSRAEQFALGFVCCFGVFSGTTGPFLVLHLSFSAAVWAASAVWIAAFAAIEIARRRPLANEGEAAPSTDVPTLNLLAGRWPGLFAALLLTSLAAAWAFSEGIPSRRGSSLLVMALLGCNAGAVLLVFRSGALRTVETDRAVDPGLQRWATLAMAGLVIFQMASSAVYVREDMDDTLHLWQISSLQNAPAMATEAPNHLGEGLPPNPIYAWQAWELWGAALTEASGLHPIIAFRSVLAPVLVLLAAVLYAAVLRRVLPSAVVPIAMVVLLAYMVWGMSSHHTANNFLLTRAAQGKTWQMHIAVPSLVLLTIEYMRHARLSSWCFVILASLAALGWGPSSIPLVPMLMGTLLAACWVAYPRRVILRRAVVAGVAVLPQLALGVYAASALPENLLLDPARGEDVGVVRNVRWRDAFLFSHLNLSNDGGALEIFALVATPLAFVFLGRRSQRIYPIAFSYLFFLGVANPFLFPFVTSHLVPASGYVRFFHLVPFGLLLGCVGVAVALVSAGFGSRRSHRALALVAFVAVMPLVGANYVWSPANVYFGSHSPQPYIATNPYKMPDGLLHVAKSLRAKPHGPDHRVLCSERSASHLAGFDASFVFVFTRIYQTRIPLLYAGRRAEADRRELLARGFLSGTVDPARVQELLNESRTAYVVLDREDDSVVRPLREFGFQRTTRVHPYSLWERRGHRPRASGDVRLASSERPH